MRRKPACNPEAFSNSFLLCRGFIPKIETSVPKSADSFSSSGTGGSLLPEKLLEIALRLFYGTASLSGESARYAGGRGPVVAEVGFVSDPLELGLRLDAFVVAGFGVEAAVEADMEVAAAIGTGALAREIFVYGDFFSTERTDVHGSMITSPDAVPKHA